MFFRTNAGLIEGLIYSKVLRWSSFVKAPAKLACMVVFLAGSAQESETFYEYNCTLKQA
jgi:hypothetical protein